MIQAAKFGQLEEAAEAIELSEEEKAMEAKLRVSIDVCTFSALAVCVQCQEEGCSVALLPCILFCRVLMPPYNYNNIKTVTRSKIV